MAQMAISRRDGRAAAVPLSVSADPHPDSRRRLVPYRRSADIPWATSVSRLLRVRRTRNILLDRTFFQAIWRDLVRYARLRVDRRRGNRSSALLPGAAAKAGLGNP